MGWGGGGGAGAHSSSAKQTATTPMGEWYTWLMYPSFRTDERCPGSVDAFANCRENMTKTSFAVLRWKKPREESSAACDSMTGPSLPGASVPGLNTAENRIFMPQGGSGADRRGVRKKKIFSAYRRAHLLGTLSSSPIPRLGCLFSFFLSFPSWESTVHRAASLSCLSP